jgi:hypothetical protein
LEENEAWEIAKRRDSIFHYLEKYLEKYPNGKYSQEAASARDQTSAIERTYSDFSDSP